MRLPPAESRLFIYVRKFAPGTATECARPPRAPPPVYEHMFAALWKVSICEHTRHTHAVIRLWSCQRVCSECFQMRTRAFALRHVIAKLFRNNFVMFKWVSFVGDAGVRVWCSARMGVCENDTARLCRDARARPHAMYATRHTHKRRAHAAKMNAQSVLVQFGGKTSPHAVAFGCE